MNESNMGVEKMFSGKFHDVNLVVEHPSDELIEKYSCGNMYVDYPHKSKWEEAFGLEDHTEALRDMYSDNIAPPALLYVHIPFCEELCYFCLCHKTITSNADRINSYMGYLYREIDILRESFEKNGLTPNFKEVHLGGGSPTILWESEFDKLIDKLASIMEIDSLFELTLEVDPRIVTEDMLHYYHEKGVTRLSFGIQDFDAKVAKAVNRENPPEMLDKLLTPSIREKFPSINFDILCGLPHQTLESFKKTIGLVSRFSPSSVEVAFVNYTTKSQKGQRLIKKSDCPGDVERHRLFLQAKEQLLENGYLCVGFDRFALPEDRIIDHLRNKTLRWNPLGFAPGEISNVIGVGVSSASRISKNYYYQNEYGYEEYEKAIDAGHLPVYRGRKLTEDDILRREIMEDFRCYNRVSKSDIETRYGIDFDQYFSGELELLQNFVDDQILNVTENEIKVTPMGTVFTNNVCRLWDIYGPNYLSPDSYFQKISTRDTRTA